MASSFHIPTSPVTPREQMHLATVLQGTTGLPKLSSLPTRDRGESISLPPLSQNTYGNRGSNKNSRYLPSLASQSFPVSPTAPNFSKHATQNACEDSLIQRLRDFTATPPQEPSTKTKHQPNALPIVRLLSTSAAESKSDGRTDGRSDARWESVEDSPHICQKCNASFRRRDNLTAHIRAQHKGERPFRCDVCGFRFIKKDHAMKHWKVVHLKERPFVCNRCDSRFGQRSDLNKHVRSVHLRIKPFQCEHCGLRFSHRGNQIRHQAVVHEKKKPFSCSLCSFTFAEKSNLLKHCQAVHKTVPVAQATSARGAPNHSERSDHHGHGRGHSRRQHNQQEPQPHAQHQHRHQHVFLPKVYTSPTSKATRMPTLMPSSSTPCTPLAPPASLV